MTIDHYLSLDAGAMVEGLAAGEFTPFELMTCAVEQKDRFNGRLNAIHVDLTESALKQAESSVLQSGSRQNATHLAIPFLIKDLTPLKGTRLTHGSRLFTAADAISGPSSALDTQADSGTCGAAISDHNASIVQRYLDSGLMVLGKTNTPEFGLSVTTESVANGPCLNPWHTAYSTGGSSGGAAAAVAAGIVPVAHATDAGGSIRIPANCCGLVGLKPSRGLVVADNSDIGSRSGLTVHHVLSRTVRDSAFFLDMIRLHQPGAFPLPSVQQGLADACQQAPKPLRIALQIEHPFGESIDPECLHAATTMAKLCESLGHQIEELNTFPDYRAAARAMNKILCANTFQQIKAVLRRSDLSMKQAELETSTRQMAEVGSRITAIDYIEAIVTLDRISEQMKNLFGPVSLILSPVLAKTTARLGWLNMNAVNLEEYAARYRSYSGFTPLANGAGLPSLSIPSIRTADGLPVGAMFTGPWGSDLVLLQLARQIEKVQPWPLLAPMVTG